MQISPNAGLTSGQKGCHAGLNEFSGKVKVPSISLASSDVFAAVWLGWVGRYTPPGILMRMHCLPCATALRMSERERWQLKKEGDSRKMQMRQSSRGAWCVW